MSLVLPSDGSGTNRRTEGGGVSSDLSFQTFGPITTQFRTNVKVYRQNEPMSGRDALEVLPPNFNRLKCKPVYSAVKKQIEHFVPLVPYRARRFSWTRFWTADTLDAEQDQRRRHKPDTVFFVCGFNAMGEFDVGSFFISLFSCRGCSVRRGCVSL